MRFINDFEGFVFEAEIAEIPTDITSGKIWQKSPEQLEAEYEKQLGREGKLSQHFRKTGKKFTFGVLRSIFEDAIKYKKKREIIKGGYKMIHRAVPMALAFVFFPLWLAGNILGASRALNKIIQPMLKNPEKNYNEFLVKVIKGTMAFMEGEIKYVMKDDWFYSAFVMEDKLIKMVRKDVLRIFAVELAEKMANEPDDKEVPHHYVENELKKFLNEKFDIMPPMELKSSRPKHKGESWSKND